VKKRLFVAIEMPGDVREQIGRYIDHLRSAVPGAKVSWTKTENLHLTLKFLGSVDFDLVPGIFGALEAALLDINEFRLEIAGIGVFPFARKARVLWLGVQDESGRLARAASQIEDRLATLGFPKDDREFSPHLTIGRSRREHIAREVVDVLLGDPFRPMAFNVDRVVLNESTLTPSGPIYSEVGSYGLAEIR